MEIAQTDGRGSRFAFTARFLGRSLTYTYEVVDMQPGAVRDAHAEGPFPTETTYLWEDGPNGTTKMTLRNRGEPSGFSGMVAPLLAMSIKRANAKDLARLKSLLEAGG